MASQSATSPQLQRTSETPRGTGLQRTSNVSRNNEPQVSADVRTTVIILKKMQGSVWRETGRTTVCPTPEWLTASYGAGEYELRLKRGNRVVCMVGVSAS